MDYYINRGENAYHIGLTRNPYTLNSLAWSAWNQGWKDAERMDTKPKANFNGD